MGVILYMVIPCYNEEQVINKTVRCLSEKLSCMNGDKLISSDSRILLVNDGSTDRTWTIIEELYKSNDWVIGINLSRNYGHQNALMAGYMMARDYADIAISMDADLQDDVSVLDKFVMEYNNGAQIVYGVRNSRKKDGIFKKNTAYLFYGLMNKLGVELVSDHAEYRLLSRKALEELDRYKEVNLFIRGIIPMLGFKTAVVNYERKERAAGETKYPLLKMISFAINGITSLSVKPIKMITSIGLLISLISFGFLLYVIIETIIGVDLVRGWPTIVVLICFFGGFQIMCIGIVGEYIGKIYDETKKRPRYIIENTILK